MATQLLTAATLAGKSATVVTELAQALRAAPDPDAVDRFCAALGENGWALPVLYFCEWLDRWLMGDEVPGPEPLEGRRFQLAVFTPGQAVAWAGQLPTQFAEQEWLARRLREAASAWDGDGPRVVVLVREAFGPSTDDEEILASLPTVPPWLAPFRPPTTPG